jgi:autotransporter passenger strand-loop-strand repeat protein
VSSGGLLVLDGGTTTDVTIQTGGALGLGGTLTSSFTAGPVTSTMVVSGVTLSSGDYEDLDGATVRSGAEAYISAGGVASNIVVSGGAVARVLAGGTTTGTVVSSGGAEYVSSGGVASATTVRSGGRAYVLSGGGAIGATVSSGGFEYVLASGTTTGTVASNGGWQMVSSGGVASQTRVLSGGRDHIYAGGVASGLALASGGVVFDDGEVRIAGAATLAGTLSGSGAIIQTAAGDLVLSDAGAAFDGHAVINGGTIELGTAHALGTGYVQFVETSTGSAVLQIDAADAPPAGGTFANVISNFSGAHEDIDLRSIAFVAGASATLTGTTLVLSDSGKTYKFKLSGTMAGAYPVLSDGHGGTLIDPTTAPKVLDPRVTLFAQATAAFAPSDAVKTALVSGTSPTGQTPFAYSIGSGGTMHL